MNFSSTGHRLLALLGLLRLTLLRLLGEALGLQPETKSRFWSNMNSNLNCFASRPIPKNFTDEIFLQLGEQGRGGFSFLLLLGAFARLALFGRALLLFGALAGLVL